MNNVIIEEIILRLQQARGNNNVALEQIESGLGLGPGWVADLENGLIEPKIDMLIGIAKAVGIDMSNIMANLPEVEIQNILNHNIFAESATLDGKSGLRFKFQYNTYPATYFLANASYEEYEKITDNFRRLIADPKISKTETVVLIFQQFCSTWPNANPSDIWWFILSRLYSNAYYHPSSEANRDLGQSWKRTAGWALEKIIVQHYRDFLANHDIEIGMFPKEETSELLDAMNLNYNVEAAKADILLVDLTQPDNRSCFGVIHVKASIAERRQNDQNFSMELLKKNFFSPFMTMDCKSNPSQTPFNKGEFGAILNEDDDPRIDKRKEFEEEGYYSGCFSFNANTLPTPKGQKATGRIFSLNFNSADDDFSRLAIAARDRLYGG